jgi:hypothetical protein
MEINLKLTVEEVNGVLGLLNQAASQAQSLADQAASAQLLFTKVRDQAIAQVPQDPPAEKVEVEVV